MTTLLETVRTRRQATPEVRSISWRSVGEMVQISVEMINDSSERTTPDTLVIEAAAFGAFVPNVPIARTAVGALDPGEERAITTTVSRATLDRATQRASSRKAFQDVLKAMAGSHWIGNLNVYFERAPEQAVERHCAFDLEVPAGKNVTAMFFVGETDCTFQTRCSVEAWSARVVPIGRRRDVVLFVRAPGDPGKRANVTVDVIRTRDGKVVPVEFRFQTVSGRGETLGCITV
jgi:predicted SnoaL-like aldol condensation-catalyzing enzyme